MKNYKLKPTLEIKPSEIPKDQLHYTIHYVDSAYKLVYSVGGADVATVNGCLSMPSKGLHVAMILENENYLNGGAGE